MRSAGKRQKRLVLALTAGLCLAIALPGHADSDHDHDRARQALEAGEILPLRTVLEKLARDVPGQVMEVELERRGERWIYEIKLLRPGGALIKLKVDARDAAVLPARDNAPKN
ncbi:MAG: peptidase propeptide and ypeb protein [Proteobacteria bacterium]|nr:peptidase propeptide and ypeb protein [Pseudomonadota bacterium]